MIDVAAERNVGPHQIVVHVIGDGMCRPIEEEGYLIPTIGHVRNAMRTAATILNDFHPPAFTHVKKDRRARILGASANDKVTSRQIIGPRPDKKIDSVRSEERRVGKE